VPKGLLHQSPRLRRPTLRLLAPQGQVGTQPAQRLLAQTGAVLVVEPGGVFPLASGGEGGGAGGVVAVAGLQVFGQFGLGLEGRL
jgi:hypothetical protein